MTTHTQYLYDKILIIFIQSGDKQGLSYLKMYAYVTESNSN